MTTPPDEMEKIMQRLAEAHSLSILREKELIPTKKDFMTLGFQKFLRESYIAGARQWREIGRAEGAKNAFLLASKFPQPYTIRQFRDLLLEESREWYKKLEALLK